MSRYEFSGAGLQRRVTPRYSSATLFGGPRISRGMSTHAITDVDSATPDRVLRVLTVLLSVVGAGLIFFGSPLQTTVGIVLFILSVVTFLGVVKHTFEGHPDW